MENLRVATLHRHKYGGKVRWPGDEYHVDNEKHLKFLLAIKKVRKVEVELKLKTAPMQKRPVERKGMQSGKFGGYQRKDVRKSPQNKSPAAK